MLHQTVKSRIALLGSPEGTGHYSGFESFAERVAPALAAEVREVWVSCGGTRELETYTDTRLHTPSR